MTIRALMKRRADFNQMLSGMNNLNSSRYFRLMGLAGIELLLGIPWGVYASLYLNIHSAKGASASPIYPWISWANVHANFGYVGQFPAFEWKALPTNVVTLELSRWSCVICSFIFFAFFGFAQEARKNYRLMFNSVAKRVGYTTVGFSGMSSSFAGTKQPTSSTTGRGILPVFIQRETTSKRDSYASFSTNLTLGDVGGTLDDVKEPYSPTGSASGSSRYSLDEKDASPTAPSHPPALSPPETSLDMGSPPSAELPHGRPDSATIV